MPYPFPYSLLSCLFICCFWWSPDLFPASWVTQFPSPFLMALLLRCHTLDTLWLSSSKGTSLFPAHSALLALMLGLPRTSHQTGGWPFSLYEWDKLWNLAADVLRHLSLDFHNSYHPGVTHTDKTEEMLPRINQPKGKACNNLVLLDLFIRPLEEFGSWEEEQSKGGQVCLSKQTLECSLLEHSQEVGMGGRE